MKISKNLILIISLAINLLAQKNINPLAALAGIGAKDAFDIAIEIQDRIHEKENNSVDSLEENIEKSISKWFSLTHPKTWFMSYDYYYDLWNKRMYLVFLVRNNDWLTAQELLSNKTVGARIESYDPILKLLINLSINKGYEEMAELLAKQAHLNHVYFRKKAQYIRLRKECDAAETRYWLTDKLWKTDPLAELSLVVKKSDKTT